MKKLIRLTVGLIVAQLASGVYASQYNGLFENTSKLHWQLSPYTYHYTYDEEHKNVLMLGLEREQANGKLDGFTAFSNSFGQPCVYVYPWGGAWHGIGGMDALSFKWTAGVLFGYKPPYDKKLPLNYSGYSPVAIMGLAYEFAPGWSVQADMLGNAALMFQLSVPFNPF